MGFFQVTTGFYLVIMATHLWTCLYVCVHVRVCMQVCVCMSLFVFYDISSELSEQNEDKKAIQVKTKWISLKSAPADRFALPWFYGFSWQNSVCENQLSRRTFMNFEKWQKIRRKNMWKKKKNTNKEIDIKIKEKKEEYSKDGTILR